MIPLTVRSERRPWWAPWRGPRFLVRTELPEERWVGRMFEGDVLVEKVARRSPACRCEDAFYGPAGARCSVCGGISPPEVVIHVDQANRLVGASASPATILDVLKKAGTA